MRLAKFLIAAAVFGSAAAASEVADEAAVTNAASASASAAADVPVSDSEGVETFRYEVRAVDLGINLCVLGLC